ncbi:MAG: aminopeptidase [Dethiobacter sp.]|jgi:aminopeptidase|nr:aminopeptidase [Dethiobacter sp.]
MDNMLEKYARLIVKTGVNIQQGQTLVITSPIECATFARMIAETAYREGARDVIVNWRDELLTKIRFLLAPEEVFDEFPSWQKELYLSYFRQGAAFVSISASDPELMKDVEPDRIVRAHKSSSSAVKEYREGLMAHKNPWCVVSIPTASWAKKIFPGHSADDAVAKLWEAIFMCVRVDTEDPVAAWEEHKSTLEKSIDFLNSANLRFLRFENSLGTDLLVELPQNHVWHGGSSRTAEGTDFIANMPTEEVFTLPKKTGVNGTVVSSMPLNYNGNLIEHFSLTFKDGKIIDYSAEKGYKTLKKLLETDEGSRYLGEVALVPYDSPISKLKILFYNTLFDENASCHLAIGKAYPICISNCESMSKEELVESGMNDSLIHEDFMIGTQDLNITGIDAGGKEIAVFKNGNYAF